MSDRCSTSRPSGVMPKKHICPVNGKAYRQVSPNTIKHHIKAPWAWREKNQGYYFCPDPDCRVVYYGEDDSVIEKEAVRTEVRLKESSENALVCYCYGVSKLEARTNPRIREFVVEETTQHRCACEFRNPSGRCCLGEFPKP